MIEYNNQAEGTVIGCMLLDAEKIPTILATVTQDDFHSPLCNKAFGIIKKIHDSGTVPDIVNVGSYFSKANRTDLTKCCMDIPTTSNVMQYARVVKDTAKKLKAQAMAVKLIDNITCESELTDCQTLALQISEALNTAEHEKSLSAADGYKLFYKTKTTPKTYIKTGMWRLDKYLYLDNGDYIVIGGRPSSGKTAFTLQMAVNIAKIHKVAYFSLETSAEKIYDRLISNYTKTKLSSIKQGTISAEEWVNIADAGEEFAKLKIEVVEAAGWTVEQIRAKAIQLQANVIFVDYLGLIKSDGKNLYERVTNISNDLHIMAQQSKIAVIALAQLNREGKSEPDMSHLRESGAIEQDADAILLLHTPSEENRHEKKLIVAKNKEGEVGKLDLTFAGEYQKFTEIEKRY